MDDIGYNLYVKIKLKNKIILTFLSFLLNILKKNACCLYELDVYISNIHI